MNTAEALARALGAKRAGRQWLCRCPVPGHGKGRGDVNPSLIMFDGHAAVQLRCMAGCAPADVIAALRARGLWPGAEGRPRVHSLKQGPSPAEIADAANAHRNRESALRLWEDTLPALGSGVEFYLERRRGLSLDDLVDEERRRLLTEVIRYHPACPCERERRPAMVCLMRSLIGDQPKAVQRIFLDASWRKIGSRMLGPVQATAIKLAPVTSRLAVCEGAETALACLVLGEPVVWALGSAEALRRLPPLPGVRDLLVRADNDINGVGQQAAAECVEVWRQAGRWARATWPARSGQDFADVASERNRQSHKAERLLMSHNRE